MSSKIKGNVGDRVRIVSLTGDASAKFNIGEETVILSAGTSRASAVLKSSRGGWGDKNESWHVQSQDYEVIGPAEPSRPAAPKVRSWVDCLRPRKG